MRCSATRGASSAPAASPRLRDAADVAATTAQAWKDDEELYQLRAKIRDAVSADRSATLDAFVEFTMREYRFATYPEALSAFKQRNNLP